MSDSDSPARGVSRRALLAGGVAFGSALAGCSITVPQAELESANDLEEELLEKQERIAHLESEIESYREQIDTWNIWGFSEQELHQLQLVADQWRRSSIVIDVLTEHGFWATGTGWVFDTNVIATNAHVVRPFRLQNDLPLEYVIWTYEGDRLSGDLIGYTFGEVKLFSDQEDIAFLELSDERLPERVVPRGNSDDLTGGEPLVQIGHPWSLEHWTASVGPFVAHRSPFFLSNVPGQPGVSGSPVFDLDGEVIGMTWGGQYHRVTERHPDQAPVPGDGEIHLTFEETVNGIHSYVDRIETAFDALA